MQAQILPVLHVLEICISASMLGKDEMFLKVFICPEIRRVYMGHGRHYVWDGQSYMTNFILGWHITVCIYGIYGSMLLSNVFFLI